MENKSKVELERGLKTLRAILAIIALLMLGFIGYYGMTVWQDIWNQNHSLGISALVMLAAVFTMIAARAKGIEKQLEKLKEDPKSKNNH
jgi:TRAP-type C4-dicarboxylate transport system permease small subunit